MAYVIVDSCTKDLHCIEACPVDCIHPKQEEPGFESVSQLFIHPEECIDCAACVPVCPTNSIFPIEELLEAQKQFAEVNARHYNA
jgi:NAD-dependent dihydropyrimidine dehydrogenase PreA subunit